MTCDPECLAKAKLKQGVTYRVRDIFHRKDVGEMSITDTGLTMEVKGDAGSVMVKLTPI